MLTREETIIENVKSKIEENVSYFDLCLDEKIVYKDYIKKNSSNVFFGDLIENHDITDAFMEHHKLDIKNQIDFFRSIDNIAEKYLHKEGPYGGSWVNDINPLQREYFEMISYIDVFDGLVVYSNRSVQNLATNALKLIYHHLNDNKID